MRSLKILALAATVAALLAGPVMAQELTSMDSAMSAPASDTAVSKDTMAKKHHKKAKKAAHKTSAKKHHKKAKAAADSMTMGQ